LTTDNTHTTHNTTHTQHNKHSHKHTHIRHTTTNTQRHTNTHHNDKLAAHTTNNCTNAKHETRHIQTTHNTYKRNTKRDTRNKRTTLLSYASTHSSKPRSTRARPCIHGGEPMRITEHIHTARRQNTQKQKRERERKHGSREQQLCSVVSISRPSSGNSTTADHRPPTSTYHLALTTYPSVSERVQSRGCR
jgi:hypothetical protein